jgi:hypothetical protein
MPHLGIRDRNTKTARPLRNGQGGGGLVYYRISAERQRGVRMSSSLLQCPVPLWTTFGTRKQAGIQNREYVDLQVATDLRAKLVAFPPNQSNLN